MVVKLVKVSTYLDVNSVFFYIFNLKFQKLKKSLWVVYIFSNCFFFAEIFQLSFSLFTVDFLFRTLIYHKFCFL